MNTEDNNDFYDDELSRSLISNDFEGDTPHRKKKSKKPLVICLIILLIAAAAGGTAWYMMQRHKPVEATEKFLTGMQNMDLPQWRTFSRVMISALWMMQISVILLTQISSLPSTKK